MRRVFAFLAAELLELKPVGATGFLMGAVIARAADVALQTSKSD